MVNQFFNDSVFLSAFGSLHVSLGYFLDELVNCRLIHQLDFLLPSGIVIEASFINLFLLVFLQCFLHIIMVPRCQVDLMFQVIVFFLEEPAIRFLNRMELVKNIERVLQRHRSMKSLHHINHSPLSPAYPVCELHVIRHCGTQHDNSNMLWQHDNSLFPHDASLFIVDVMDLIKDDPFDVPDHFGTTVQVVP
jgi:hypothetical protein